MTREETIQLLDEYTFYNNARDQRMQVLTAYGHEFDLIVDVLEKIPVNLHQEICEKACEKSLHQYYEKNGLPDDLEQLPLLESSISNINTDPLISRH